jgi:N,N'-diacetyllegionaminate synthase
MFIAEASCNHLGSMALALNMIDVAKEAGADIVKFQMYVTEKINDPKLHKFLEMCRFTEEQHRFLKKHAENVGIEYMCSAFDVESVEALGRLGVTRIKIPSGQIHNKEILKAVANLNIPVIISTGMCDKREVETAAYYPLAHDLTILHCNTAYPTPDKDANLNAIKTLIKEYYPPRKVGYSDHTIGLTASIAAAALGAEVIEKHFILSRNIRTPDTAVSLEPQELGVLVGEVKRVREMLGDGIKRPTESEKPFTHRKESNGNKGNQGQN